VPALAFLMSHPDTRMCISVITETEFIEGVADMQTNQRHHPPTSSGIR